VVEVGRLDGHGVDNWNAGSACVRALRFTHAATESIARPGGYCACAKGGYQRVCLGCTAVDTVSRAMCPNRTQVHIFAKQEATDETPCQKRHSGRKNSVSRQEDKKSDSCPNLTVLFL
jgi:hypothetical protein